MAERPSNLDEAQQQRRMAKKEMIKPLLGNECEIHNYSLQKITVGILGTGDFARSLATRLVCSGYDVIVGSRYPKCNESLFPSAIEVTSQREATNRANIIFVAVHHEHYSTLNKLRDGLMGKILVDVSNNVEVNEREESNAERLASMFPESTVVKAFNLISAWALQSGARDGSKQVMICSNSQEARCMVVEIARNMGFIPLDFGLLSSAKEIENLPLRLFPSWKMPIILTVVLFVLFYVYSFIRKVIHPYVMKGQNVFYKIPISVVNVALPCVSFVMLSLVYLPGVLAALFQLRNGTKYKRFPCWLDQWLQQRKQLGLLSFLCAALHAVYSLCLPMRRSARYQLLNEASALSRLGFTALVVSTLHVLTFGWRKAFDSTQYKFYLPPTFAITLIVPCIVLPTKAFLFLPCVNRKLKRIRRGWETSHQAKFREPGEADSVAHFSMESTSRV
ncbi:metalloreductase STEAP3 isoform X3 [Amblyraja radiata]|uniref:metalloreductase STEAP3 isoform X3 n=1 Tax=Amblyraja radiata TaxID=386614 RepID=UPI001403654F|nr:metalloreductase STEAP3 isoform X3 [Amblyraja radiata]